MRRTLGQIRAYFSELGAEHPADAAAVAEAIAMSRRARAGIYVGRLSLRILKQWARDRCPQQAAALAFQTSLSLVPILAIAFALLRSMGLMNAESSLLAYVGERMLPDLGDVTPHLQSFSEKISIGAAGGAGLLFTLVTCFALYSSVEKIFNDIWRVSRRRSVVGNFLTFYALVTLLPVLGATSLYWSGKLIGASRLAQFLGPLVIQIAALSLTNKLLPNTVVSWRAAFAGALATSVAIEGMKFGFIHFARRMLLDTYSGVYGPMGLVPIVLVWIYLSWLLVLLGAEIANAIQNLRLLEAEERRKQDEEPVNGLIATQLLALVAAHHERGGRGLTREALATEFGLTPDVVGRIADRLKERGLVAEVHGDKEGLIPGRASTAIPVAEILRVFRASDLETAGGAMSPVLTALVRDLERVRSERLAGMTLQELLPDEGPRPEK
jgi:membrane protein